MILELRNRAWKHHFQLRNMNDPDVSKSIVMFSVTVESEPFLKPIFSDQSRIRKKVKSWLLVQMIQKSEFIQFQI